MATAASADLASLAATESLTVPTAMARLLVAMEATVSMAMAAVDTAVVDSAAVNTAAVDTASVDTASAAMVAMTTTDGEIVSLKQH